MTGGRLQDHPLFAGQAGAQTVGHADQYRLTYSGCDRGYRILKDRECCSAAGSGSDAITWKNLQVFGYCLRVVHMRLGHRIAGYESVNLIFRNAGIVERT